ncbi:MAG: ATP-binding cassette domain-containing protein [Deltaproteobacteria bacterium]|nr:ATP-binding cassette domain-containing protein [Deltaproteobacteria bacterium]
MGLQDFKESYPKELSGGMKQHVAIARAYAVNPQVLLMDEPFGALDAQTRQFMQESLLDILEEEKKTVVFITHGCRRSHFLSTRVIGYRIQAWTHPRNHSDRYSPSSQGFVSNNSRICQDSSPKLTRWFGRNFKNNGNNLLFRFQVAFVDGLSGLFIE